MAGIRLKPLASQVVVIVGASSGIGLATARLAAARGARVLVAGRSTAALNSLVEELRAVGTDAIAVTADVAYPADVEQIGAAAISHFGAFDTWVNVAAVSAYGGALDVSLEDMRRIMDVNFWGCVAGSRVACRYLARTGGALINVGSVLSDWAAPNQAAYSASKQAIKAFTDSLRLEVVHAGLPVSITLIKPGAIDTPFAEHARNHFVDHPTHVPPVYTPRTVARAILYAAEQPARDLTIGAGARLLSLGAGLAPGLMDRTFGRWLLSAAHSGRPRHGTPILYQASERLRERGDYAGIARPSAYTALLTHRRAAVMGLLAGGAALLAWRKMRQIRNASGTSRLNTPRSTDRAAQ